MGQLAISLIATLLAAGYCAFLLARKGREISTLALAASLLACILLEVFDSLAILDPPSLLDWKKGSLIAESILPGLLLLFSVTFYREISLKTLSWFNRGLLMLSMIFGAAALAFPVGRFFISPDFAQERVLFLGQPGYFFYIGALVYFTFSLVQLERTLIALPRADKWQAKFEILGIGTLLAMFIFYYSQGLVHRSINMNLLPLRSFALLAAIALMSWSRFRRGEPRKVQVSREMAFRSLVVLFVGIYLVGLGLAGEGMRYLGDSSQKYFFVGIAFLSGFAVVAILLSEALRRKIKVFLHKNFYAQKYDYRDQWLELSRNLSSARNAEELQGAIMAYFSRTFATRGAVLFLRDGESGRYRWMAGHEMGSMNEIFEEDHSLIRHLEKRKTWVLNTREENGEFPVENDSFLREYGISFVVPLHFENTLEGFIALGSQINEGEGPTYEDYDLMKMLARQVTSTILNLKLAAQLSTARELAAIGRVSAFVLHDLKNLTSSLVLVADNARDHMDNPEFQEDMLKNIEVTVGRMKDLIARLKNMEEKATLCLEVHDLREIVAEGTKLVNGGEVHLGGEPVLARVDSAEIQKVVLNLILNALEAAPGKVPVTVEVGRCERAFFRVIDKGCGMSEDFIRNRLFKPFETTKKKGFGIGLYQSKNIVEAHGGSIEVHSELGGGSEFTVFLPLAAGRAGIPGHP